MRAPLPSLRRLAPPRRLAVGLVAGAVLAAGAAADAQTWTAPVTISAPHTFIFSLFLTPGAPAGQQAAWSWQDGIGNRAATGTSLARTPSAASPWSPQSAGPPGLLDAQRYGDGGQVLLTATVAGRGSGPYPQRTRIAVTFRHADGRLGPSHTIRVGTVAFLPKLAVGGDGRVLVAWIEHHTSRDGRYRRIVQISERRRGGSFSAARTLSGRGRADVVAAGIGPAGDAVVVFERRGRLIARTRRRHRSWGAFQDLGPTARLTRTDIATLVTTPGRVVVAWAHQQLSEGGDRGPAQLDVAIQPAGHSSFRPAQRLESEGEAGPPTLVDAADGMLLAYAETSGGHTRARVRRSTDGRTFGAPIDVSPADRDAQQVTAGAGSAGSLVAWVQPEPTSDGNGIGLAAVSPIGSGAFGTPEQVTPSENVERLAVSAEGDRFVAAWIARPEGEGPGVPISQIHTVVRWAERAAKPAQHA